MISFRDLLLALVNHYSRFKYILVVAFYALKSACNAPKEEKKRVNIFLLTTFMYIVGVIFFRYSFELMDL